MEIKIDLIVEKNSIYNLELFVYYLKANIMYLILL
jgi:hypothetical protein